MICTSSHIAVGHEVTENEMGSYLTPTGDQGNRYRVFVGKN